MPQFDPAVWSPQIVWLIVCFVALYVLMARVVLPRISHILEEREFRINDSLRRAEALKQNAEDAIATYERTMAQARNQAQAAVRISRERAAKEAAERHEELTQRLHEEMRAAEERIAAARDQALAAIRDVAVEVAELAVERLLGEKMDPKGLATTVDKVLGEGAIR